MDVNEVKARIAEEYEAEADKLLSEGNIDPILIKGKKLFRQQEQPLFN